MVKVLEISLLNIFEIECIWETKKTVDSNPTTQDNNLQTSMHAILLLKPSEMKISPRGKQTRPNCQQLEQKTWSVRTVDVANWSVMHCLTLMWNAELKYKKTQNNFRSLQGSCVFGVNATVTIKCPLHNFAGFNVKLSCLRFSFTDLLISCSFMILRYIVMETATYTRFIQMILTKAVVIGGVDWLH